MRRMTRVVLLAILGIGAIRTASAQMAMSGGGRSLGGYGAATISSYYGNGGGYVPYNGRAGAIIPTGMSAATPPRTIPNVAIGGASMVAATPIGGISAAAGMGMGMGMGRGMEARSGPRSYAPLLPGAGMGMGGGMGSRPGSVAIGRGPSGPGFGYPFRMPLEFGGSSTMGMP